MQFRVGPEFMLAVVCVLSAVCPAAAAVETVETVEKSEGSEWSRFRGPNGSGVSVSTKLPSKFGPNENVVWKTDLPQGHSSPILFGESVYLTAFEDEDLWTYSLSQTDGSLRWRVKAPRTRVTKIDDRNNAASPSPAVDTSGIYIFFPDYGLLGYTAEGAEKWRFPLPEFRNVYGMGASPIVAEEKVLLACDQNNNSFLVAVDKDTGKQAWRTDRPEAKSGHSTPILYQPPRDGELQVIVPGSFLVTAYSVSSGEKLWWVSGLSFEMKSTPVMSDGLLYVNGYGAPVNQPGNEIESVSFEDALLSADRNEDGLVGADEASGHVKGWFSFVDLDGDGGLNALEWDYYRASLASKNGILGIRLGGEGDMTESNVVWTYHRRVPQLPSPVIFEEFLYMVNDGGIVTAFKPSSGEVVSQGRLEGAVDNYFASPVAGDGKLYFASELGKVAVLNADGSLDVQVVNDLDDLIYATPAIADGRLYVRTRSALYCFGTEEGL